MSWWEWILSALAALPLVAMVFFVVFGTIAYAIAAVHLAWEHVR